MKYKKEMIKLKLFGKCKLPLNLNYHSGVKDKVDGEFLLVDVTL
jgi:hypothetical protein